MAEDKIKKQDELDDEQLDEVSGGAGWPWDANPIFPD